ncbi:MAG: hypothetical protein KGR46_07485 [Verrucomicrobia bacterium]|nr:hypothetical protein [Verrucomicrobiota bacterium]
MSYETVRNKPGVRMSIGEAIAALALVCTIFGLSQSLFILPEKVRAVEVLNEKQDQRIMGMEALAAERAETLARIDERTKRIEAALTPR